MKPDLLIVHAAGPKPTLPDIARQSLGVAATLPLFAVTPLLRPWHRRWGATPTEVAAAMPGDDLVPRCHYVISRAITIDAPPTSVWPWLAQVGFGKAGFYSYDLLDNAGHRSADRVLAEYQHPVVGDWVPMFTKVNDATAFRVARVEPPSELLWIKPDSTWSWRLRPLGPSSTRVLTRLRIQYRWRHPAEAVFSLILNEFGDFPMMRRMLLSLKARIEAAVTPPPN